MADAARGSGRAPSLDATALPRQGGPDALSLALIDARNRTLRWLQRFEEAGRLGGGAGHPTVPWWLAGRAAWFQEYWTARHVQRLRGEAADPDGLRLASIEPRADAWFASPVTSSGGGCPPDMPDPATLRAYLAQTLEATLELLETVAATDEALHVFRLALQHEDRLAERLAVAAQWLEVDPGDAASPCASPPARREREPLLVPAGPAELGSGAPTGCVPPSERGHERVQVPPLEIDAQAVSWARYAEFVADGGYDEPRWWGDEGWQWLQDTGRRAPRSVEQWRGAVVVQRHGRLQRAPAGQAAAHVSWHEARAWCRWAGRALPVEAQWERGCSAAARQGFAWGDVWEWTASPARALDGGPERRMAGWPEPGPDPAWRVLRGASSWTVPRAAHPGARRYAHPARDDLFCGFRSCAA